MATFRKRGDSWRAEICISGVRDNATFDSKAEAQYWAAKRETEIREGKNLNPRELQKYTLGKVLEIYHAEHTPNLRTQRTRDTTTSRINKMLREPICAMVLADMKKTDLEVWKGGRLKTVQLNTLQRELNTFRAAINYVCAEKEVALNNPFSKFKLPKFNDKRDRILNDDEHAALEKSLSEYSNTLVAPAIFFALEEALRLSELLALEWRDVDFDRRLLNVCRVDDVGGVSTDGTKNGETGKIPLTLKAVEILKTLPHGQQNDRIFFGLTYYGLKTAWRRVRVRACVPDIHIHDLRHNAATNTAKKTSGNIFKVLAMTRQKDVRSALRYVHVKPEDLLADLDAA